jgi:dTDP-4-amino-4,6-dideoxygalactose transaminase
MIDLVSSIFIPSRVAEKKIKRHFSELTNKKHIVITNSCRSALYLAYTALKKHGEVITSPLTCKVAIDPIVESGNEPVFADISKDDLNIEPSDIEHRLTDQTVAIQAIHFGGVSCDMEKILYIAREKKIKLIEDCAQSLGATYKGKPTGSFGDVACFSLIKNAYGIGGGILATDDYEICRQAQKNNNGLDKISLKLNIFRIIRNIISTKIRYPLFNSVHKLLMDMRRGKKSYASFKNQLRQASNMEMKIIAHQMGRWPFLHENRKLVGKKYCDLLTDYELMMNKEFNPNNSSFTKLFVYNPKIDSKKYLKILHEYGIEAMHLEQKYGSPYQKRIVCTEKSRNTGLFNYDHVHDNIISLPLYEYMNDEHVTYVVSKLKDIKAGI